MRKLYRSIKVLLERLHVTLIHSSHTSCVFSCCAAQLLTQSPSADHLLCLLFGFCSVCLFAVWQPKPENAVTIAVSSRVLFRTDREQKIFEQRGVEEYLSYQIEHENEPFAPGPAFPFVKVEAAARDDVCLFGLPHCTDVGPAVCRVSGSGGRQRPTARALPAERGAVRHRAGDLQPRARRDPPHQHHQPSQ